MAKQSRKSQTRFSRDASFARALGQLDRIAGFGRQVNRIARANARLASGATPSWQLPAHASNPNGHDPLETVSPDNRQRSSDDSGSRSGDFSTRRNANQTLKSAHDIGRANGWQRATAAVDAGGRLSKKTEQLNFAMTALSRVGGSAESETARAVSNSIGRVSDISRTLGVAKTGSSPIRAAEFSRSRVDTGAGGGVIAGARIASTISAMSSLPNVSQREFAKPSRARGSNDGGMRTGITINSAPTIVINAPAAGGNAARDVLGALRLHREELFDQMKRESARRERAQF
jgi:hypothetical protein